MKRFSQKTPCEEKSNKEKGKFRKSIIKYCNDYNSYCLYKLNWYSYSIENYIFYKLPRFIRIGNCKIFYICRIRKPNPIFMLSFLFFIIFNFNDLYFFIFFFMRNKPPSFIEFNWPLILNSTLNS